ncbi:MAG: thiamine-phosphate kinase [Bacteroidetes bacterium]|nr:thiamine-phosphate kinase [Bacteroidota bacterium]MDA0888495.1 thiamine-phosphate kinase [Bacteroidota bacterium]MDA1084138.1 thiamine-phosphate kinase [Bacteroidota bacterium]
MIEDQKPSKTALESLGEFALIEHLTKSAKTTLPSTKLSIGDDAAVLSHNGETVISTDMLVEGVHFDLGYMPLKHLGYKAVVVNLSDIYAMNAQATQILLSIAVSNRFTLEALEALYAGVHLACKTYGVDLVGGDTTSSKQGLQLSVTALGVAPKTGAVKRSGAAESELLVVSGDLGAAYMGLQVLARENEVFKANPNHKPDLDPYTYLVERQLKPEARKDIVSLLEVLEVTPTSMIDISDGLSSEVLHLCKQSEVGCKLYEEKIPLDPQFIAVCEEFNIDSTTIALSGGEDYELLFTIKQEDYDKIKGNPNLSVIGHMTSKEEGANLVTRGNEIIPLKAQGWKAF